MPSINDFQPITEQEFNSLKKEGVIKVKAPWRLKSPTNRTMAAEAYALKDEGYSIFKFTSPVASEEVKYYKTDYWPIGLALPKVNEDASMVEESHPVWKDPNQVAQTKSNGIRLSLIYSGQPSWLTRRESKVTKMLTDKTANMTWLKIPDSIKGSQLDGELVVNNLAFDNRIFPTTLSATTSIFNAAPQKTLQRLRDWNLEKDVRFVVFDAPVVNGVDISDKPYKERLAAATALVDTWNSPNVEMTKTVYDDKYKFFKELIDSGEEGVVMKDLTKGYHETRFMQKIKRNVIFDATIIGIIEGLGKYKGLPGSLIIAMSLEKSGKQVRVGKVNVGSDDDRKMVAADPKSFLGTCYEVKAQEPSKAGFQHPRFVDGLLQPRDDKTLSTCILEQTMVPEQTWEYFSETAPSIEGKWEQGQLIPPSILKEEINPADLQKEVDLAAEGQYLTFDNIEKAKKLAERRTGISDFPELTSSLKRVLGQARRTTSKGSIMKRLEKAKALNLKEEVDIWSARMQQLDSSFTASVSQYRELLDLPEGEFDIILSLL